MSRWEYTWVVAGTDPYDTLKIDDRKVRIDTYLNELGQRGWELVSVTLQDGSTSSLRRFTYWFKRPLD